MADNSMVMPKIFETGDFAEWLEHFDICALSNGWEGVQKALKLATRLQGEALIVYKEITAEHRTDYERVINVLKSALIPEEEKYIAMDAFHKRAMFPGESAQIYLYEIRKILNRAFPDLVQDAREQLLFHRFVTGLPQKISREVQLNTSIVSINDALKKAKMSMAYESTIHLDNVCGVQADGILNEDSGISSRESVNHLEQRMAKYEQSISDISQSLSDLKNGNQANYTAAISRSNENPRKLITCYYCGKKGHTARYCRDKSIGGYTSSPSNRKCYACGSISQLERAQVLSRHSGPVQMSPAHLKSHIEERDEVLLITQNKSTAKAVCVRGTLNGTNLLFMLDSGSSVSLITSDLAKTFRINQSPCRVKLMTADGDTLPISGKLKLQVSIGFLTTEHWFLIVGNLIHDVILGTEFLISNRMYLDFAGMCVHSQEIGTVKIHNMSNCFMK